jgi:hypothetical protein
VVGTRSGGVLVAQMGCSAVSEVQSVVLSGTEWGIRPSSTITLR